jgi:serine/threonine protein kinase
MGMAVGTPAYMSPEQAAGKNTDPRSDVYSLGILLYELAVGRLPFPARTLSEAARYHNQELPPRPRSIRSDLPEPLERVILKALEKDPDRRYNSALSLGTILSSTMTFSTEIQELKTAQDLSLVTEYDKSVVASTAPQSTTPLT